MQPLANLTLVLLLWLNLFGLSVLTGAITKIRNAWLNLTLGPWLFCSAGFFLEFIHGFGNLQWIWPFTTLASGALLLLSTGRLKENATWRKWRLRLRFNPWRHPGAYLCFMLLFSYAFAWRYAYPDIDASSEKLSDLSYICSYLPGATLPAHDVWLYPYLSTQYYSFQFYAAALLGRILGLDPGTTYNLAFCTLIALAGTSAAAICRETVKSIPHAKKWNGWLVWASWILGGSGVTGIVYLLTTERYPWTPMRFIGSAPLNKAPLGTFLAHYTHQSTPMELPSEPFSYSIYLGDYHPPLAGYYLAFVAILALTLYHREKLGGYLAVVGACFSWSIVSDTWNLPVELLALGGWGLYNFRELVTGKILYLIAGAIAAYVSIYPYFRYFAASSGDYNTSLKFVKWEAHTPPILLLLFLLPAFGLAFLALFSREKTTIWLGWLGLVLLFFGEYFYIDDVYSGQFDRFNSSLKWWPWTSALILITLGVRLLANRRRWIPILALFFIGYPMLYGFDLARFWWQGSKDHFAQLAGQGYLLNDDNRGLYTYLKSLPRGVTLEDPEGESYTNQSAMTLFAGQPCYLGWEGHEQLWRAYSPDISYRYDQVKLFYSGGMPAAGDWLKGQDIQYVLWFKSQDQDAAWTKINATLNGAYRWHDTFSHDTHIGMWIKNEDSLSR